MSAPPIETPATLSTSGHEDGLGRRTLIFDREYGVMLERLLLRPELGAFEQALHSRLARLSTFEDERFARVRAVERDNDTGGLTILSEFVAGNRLSDVLEFAEVRDENSPPGVDVALGFLLEVLPALGSLHATAGLTHGAVGPGRMVLTSAGQVVLLDGLFGAALERLQFTPYRLWKEFRIAMPTGASRFDVAADIAQATLSAVSLVVGRALREEDYPDGLPSLLLEVVEIAQIRGSAAFATSLQHFLQRTMPLPGQRPYPTADDAVRDLQHLVRGEIGLDRCRASLTDFIAEISRPSDPFQPAVMEPATTVAVAPRQPVKPPVENQPARTMSVAAPVRAEPTPPPLLVHPIVAVDNEGAAADASPAPAPRVVADSAAKAVASPLQIVASPIVTMPTADGRSTTEDRHVLVPGATATSAITQSGGRPEGRHYKSTIVETPSPQFPEEPVPAVPHPAPGVPSKVVPSEDVAVPSPSRWASSRRKRTRSPKAKRDRLRSLSAAPPAIAPPAPVPVIPRSAPAVPASQRATETIWEAPVVPPPPQPTFRPTAATLAPAVVPYRPVPETLWQPPVTPVPIALGRNVPTAPQVPTVIRLKAEPPSAYAPVRSEARRPPDAGRVAAQPHLHRSRAHQNAPSTFPWKLAAVAGFLLVAGVGAGGAYLTHRAAPTTQAAPPRTVSLSAQTPASASATTGSLNVSTQPAGTPVLLDGKPVGETPLTLEAVPRGRHVVTFMTSGGAVKRVIRIDAGKALSIDVPVFSGWVAVYAPIVLDIAENGRSIGTTEQGHVLLSPGEHTLTLSNRDLGYRTVETVTIEAGEERAVTVDPRGALNLNAVPWAEVWIDGQKKGETPLANLQVPLGIREILFKHPQFGERRMTARITATDATAVSVDFTKPSLP